MTETNEKIEKIIIDVRKMREKSFVPKIDNDGVDRDMGEYGISTDDAIKIACKKHELGLDLISLIKLVNEHYNEAVNPNWKEFDRQWKHIHDWRTYITDEVRTNWDKIPLIGRCAIISCCKETAGNENWD